MWYDAVHAEAQEEFLLARCRKSYSLALMQKPRRPSHLGTSSPCPRVAIRPRCDTPDFQAIAIAIETGESLASVWREYAKAAIRPYGLPTFYSQFKAWRLRRDAQPGGRAAVIDRAERDFAASQTYWGALVLPRPRVLTLGSGATLNTHEGGLQVYDNDVPRAYLPGSTLPISVVFAGWGGSISISAMRFCMDHGIAVIAAGWMAEFLTFVAPPPKAEAALVRAQVRANPLRISASVISQKVLHSKASGMVTATEAHELQTSVRKARTVAEVIRVEGRCANLYWNRRQCELKSRPHKSLPVDWKYFKSRSSSIGASGARHATHPINSMLNYCYTAVVGRLGTNLASRGACLSIGFIHGDRRARYSLVFDALEPLRPLIDNRVFQFVEKRRFDRGDFLRLSTGEVRLVPNLVKVLMEETMLPQRDIDDAAAFMIGLLRSRR